MNELDLCLDRNRDDHLLERRATLGASDGCQSENFSGNSAVTTQSVDHKEVMRYLDASV